MSIFHPVHCLWAPWSNWGTCNSSSGLQERIRVKDQEAFNGGANCTGNATETKDCPGESIKICCHCGITREELLPCRFSSKMKIRLALDQFSLPPSPSADYHFATLSAWQYFFPGCNGLRPRPVGPVLVLEPRTGPGAPGEIGP